MIREGFFKVAENGGSYIVDTFYNPVTKEVYTECVRDYDYIDCSRDKDDLYHMEIDDDARRAWLHDSGIILKGDRVMVVKGRKIPLGTVAEVVDIFDWKDRYGRTQTTYAVFSDGRKTNIDNCILIMEV